MTNLNLRNNTTNSLVYSTEQNIDSRRGEVVTQETFTLEKINKSDEFLKIFVNNLAFINSELTSLEKSILLGVLNEVNWNNVLKIERSFKQELQATLKIGRTSIFKGIKGLIAKGVLTPINTDELKEALNVRNDCSYLMNPNIIGKGNLRDIHKIRQTVTMDFDFKEREFTKKIVRTTFRDDFPAFLANQENYKIDSMGVENAPLNRTTNVVVSETDDALTPTSKTTKIGSRKASATINDDLVVGTDEPNNNSTLFSEVNDDDDVSSEYIARKQQVIQDFMTSPTYPIREDAKAVYALAGVATGAFDPNANYKDLKEAALLEDLERIDNQNAN